MDTQFANNEPEWAKGLTDEQKAAVRREAVRQGKRPAQLVKEWVLAQAASLTSPTPDCPA
jgi:hypothetical protein